MKKDRILTNILFYFGFILLLYSIFSFVYQTILTTRIDWSSLHDEELVDIRSYVIINYVTIGFKLIIASYGIYCKKHVDEAINPLFTFTIFYVVFAVLEMMGMVNTLRLEGATFKDVLSQYKYIVATASIDIISAAFYLGITFFLKLDDWKNQKEE